MVLSNIASMSIKRKGMFEPYLKSFYVRSNDPTQVKLLKVNLVIKAVLQDFCCYFLQFKNVVWSGFLPQP